MRCPRCVKPLAGIEYQDVEADFCPDCGVWLDAGELEILTARTSPIPLEPTGGEATVDCCRCGEACLLLKHPPTGIVLDRCRQGCGLWLDRGELERLLATEGPGDAATSFMKDLFRATPASAAGKEGGV